MSRFPKAYADRVAKLRVPTGFLLVAAFAYMAQPTLRTFFWGLPIAGVGLWLRAWAAGHLRKNQTLARSGPYAYTRNPLYLGTLLVALGLAVAAKRPALAVLFSSVFYCVYLPVIELEQQHLAKLFPEFEEYAAKVPMIFPKLPDNPQPGEFDWKIYRKNQEYQALLGFLAGAAYLFWRAS